MKRRKTTYRSWQTISNLPTDTTTNIFTRLNLPDRQKSQLVCKDWYKTLNSNNCLILCRMRNDRSKLYTVMYKVDHHATRLIARSVECRIPEERMRIVGSSSDRVCFASMSNYGDFYVYSPGMSKTIKLPKPDDLEELEDVDSYVEPRDYFPCGFAFDKTTNTYKVVYIVSSFSVDNGVRTEIEICSFERYGSPNPTWRRVDDHPSFVSRDTSCTNSMVLVNGALHWLAKYTGFVSGHMHFGIIAVLDVANESSKIFDMPAHSEYTTLGVLNDCLCICGEVEDECKIWVMKDYGVESSWTVEYSFEKEIFGLFHNFDCVKVVRRMSNGSVLLYCGGDQGYYDSEKDEFKEIVFDKILPGANKMEIIDHGLSLIPYSILSF